MRQMLMPFCEYRQDGWDVETGKKMPQMQIFKYSNFSKQGNLYTM